MKRSILITLTFILLFVVAGCSNGSVKSVIEEYYSKKLSDADSYSIKIESATDIKKSDSDYEDIIKYTTKAFNCREQDITNLQEIEVKVKTDYGYEEEYTSYFIVGEIGGELIIIDKDDGSWGDGYSYGGKGGGGYTVTFG